MALRKPVVLDPATGRHQNLQTGDTLDAVINTADEVSLSNGGASTAPPGSPVYISATNAFQLARANAAGTTKTIGLTSASIAAAASGAVRKDGTLTLTTAQWDAVTTQTGGLTPGADYFLSQAAAGQMVVTTPPTSGYVQKLGTALSSTDFELQLNEPFQL
ncbi:MAG: hypothetical protein KME27_10525 [Lyngbya sp. HA4199-MV5]|jgi:uncharacterized protein YaiE (UPF0345 family)|nr:hypothetical protein [Lyngbya sp. HA4199-MV5]